MVENQGGDPGFIDNPAVMPAARGTVEVTAPADGFVREVRAGQIGLAVMTLGAGRETKESVIDLAVGIRLEKKAGEQVKKGEPLAVMFVNDTNNAGSAGEMVLGAYDIGPEPPEPRRLIWGTVSSKGMTMRRSG